MLICIHTLSSSPPPLPALRAFACCLPVNCVSSGAYGLWLEETFTDGSSQECTTFDNEPLASTESFKVHEIELWGFVRDF